jgi:hypothetical protein
MWRRDPRDAVGRELPESRGRVVGPENDGRSLPAWNRVEPMVVARGRHRGNPNLVPIERQIDVNRLAGLRRAKPLGETEARVERNRAWEILGEQDDLEGSGSWACAVTARLRK